MSDDAKEVAGCIQGLVFAVLLLFAGGALWNFILIDEDTCDVAIITKDQVTCDGHRALYRAPEGVIVTATPGRVRHEP